MPLYKNIEQQVPGKEYCVKNTKQKRCRYFALLGVVAGALSVWTAAWGLQIVVKNGLGALRQLVGRNF